MFGRQGKQISQQLEELIGIQREHRKELADYHEEVRSHAGESRTALEEFREFNREILLRNEKVYLTVIARLEELGEGIRSNREETQAQTRALMKLMDRFDGGSSSATA